MSDTSFSIEDYLNVNNFPSIEIDIEEDSDRSIYINDSEIEDIDQRVKRIVENIWTTVEYESSKREIERLLGDDLNTDRSSFLCKHSSIECSLPFDDDVFPPKTSNSVIEEDHLSTKSRHHFEMEYQQPVNDSQIGIGEQKTEESHSVDLRSFLLYWVLLVEQRKDKEADAVQYESRSLYPFVLIPR